MTKIWQRACNMMYIISAWPAYSRKQQAVREQSLIPHSESERLMQEQAMARHFQELSLKGMGSNIVHVAKKPQGPAKQAWSILEHRKRRKAYRSINLQPFHHPMELLAFWLLVWSKACQNDGKTRAMKTGIVATQKQTEIKGFR